MLATWRLARRLEKNPAFCIVRGVHWTQCCPLLQYNGRSAWEFACFQGRAAKLLSSHTSHKGTWKIQRGTFWQTSFSKAKLNKLLKPSPAFPGMYWSRVIIGASRGMRVSMAERVWWDGWGIECYDYDDIDDIRYSYMNSYDRNYPARAMWNMSPSSPLEVLGWWVTVDIDFSSWIMSYLSDAPSNCRLVQNHVSWMYVSVYMLTLIYSTEHNSSCANHPTTH